MHQHPRCECHECTQARFQMSIQGQLSSLGVYQTKHYSDGTIASGIGPLPLLSPSQQEVR